MSLPDSAITGSAAPSAVATTGQIKLKELKKTLTFGVHSSQSRLFKIDNKISRTSVADPVIAEPVVVSENQFLIIGKKPGETTIYIWDDEDGKAGMNVIVETNKHICCRQKYGSKRRFSVGKT